jgi:hypothetical protein
VLTPVILATQDTEIRRIKVQSQLRQIVPQNPISKKQQQHRKRLVECLKVKALSSNPNITKKKKKATIVSYIFLDKWHIIYSKCPVATLSTSDPVNGR